MKIVRYESLVNNAIIHQLLPPYLAFHDNLRYPPRATISAKVTKSPEHEAPTGQLSKQRSKKGKKKKTKKITFKNLSKMFGKKRKAKHPSFPNTYV